MATLIDAPMQLHLIFTRAPLVSAPQGVHEKRISRNITREKRRKCINKVVVEACAGRWVSNRFPIETAAARFRRQMVLRRGTVSLKTLTIVRLFVRRHATFVLLFRRSLNEKWARLDHNANYEASLCGASEF